MGVGEGTGKGSGRGDICPGLLWGIIWFLILIFLGWPVGFFIAWLYVLLLPFSACIEPLKEVCEAILKVVQLPLTCAENMIAMKPLCDSHYTNMGLGEGIGGGSGRGDVCPGILYSLVWLILLLLLAWPIAFLVVFFYVLLLPFGACISAVKDINDAIFKLVSLPFTCARNMMEMKSFS